MDKNKNIIETTEYTVHEEPTVVGPEAILPDPFWPVDAVPRHLSKEQMKEAKEIGSFVALKEQDWKCEKCGKTVGQSKDDPRYCIQCANEENKKFAIEKKINSTWQEEAKNLGLELFERQPDETDTEWRIWEAYKGYYPMKLPTWTELARVVGCAPGTVVKAAHKWNFKIRILDWARYCDASNQEERVKQVQEINTAQLNHANKMMELVGKALEVLQPEYMKPNEIVSMAKLAADMQRKVVEYKPEQIEQPGMTDRTTAKQELTKKEDLTEIAEILIKTGALTGKTIGIEQSTKLVVKGGDD